MSFRERLFLTVYVKSEERGYGVYSTHVDAVPEAGEDRVEGPADEAPHADGRRHPAGEPHLGVIPGPFGQGHQHGGRGHGVAQQVQVSEARALEDVVDHGGDVVQPHLVPAARQNRKSRLGPGTAQINPNPESGATQPGHQR